MKRSNRLFDQIWLHENLKSAFRKAAKGKRHQVAVRSFEENLVANLASMRDNAKNGNFDFGRFHRFKIRDPKPREIHACPFEERVLHHAIMNVCHATFERKLIFDTYACRIGKGREAALVRAQKHCRSHRFFLKLDIAGYFASISHTHLKDQLERLFKECRLKDLFCRIIDSYATEPGRGLPIGTLTSQYFANLYLVGLDRFVKETLGAPAYIRYMDDFVIWGDDPATLQQRLREIEAFLEKRLALRLHRKQILGRCQEGLPFLGLRLNPESRWLERRGRVRYQARMRLHEQDCAAGRLSPKELQRRLDAMNAASGLADRLGWRRRFWKTRKELDI